MIERERKIAAEKAAESGKPENVQEKMVDGAVKKYAKENALLSQLFVMDNKTPIADVVAAAGKEAGKEITLKDYVRNHDAVCFKSSNRNGSHDQAAYSAASSTSQISGRVPKRMGKRLVPRPALTITIWPPSTICPQANRSP